MQLAPPPPPLASSACDAEVLAEPVQAEAPAHRAPAPPFSSALPPAPAAPAAEDEPFPPTQPTKYVNETPGAVA